MIQKCLVCETEYGEKEPMENTALTHGYCPTCAPANLAVAKHEEKAILYLCVVCGATRVISPGIENATCWNCQSKMLPHKIEDNGGASAPEEKK